MTYNFDPDRWYDLHRTQLEVRRSNGEINKSEFDRELSELDHRYEEMVARLDGTYEIPRDRSE
jgi:hypothetical protein